MVEVVDEEDGSVAHVLDVQTLSADAAAPVLEPGAALRGSIDWPRRFDHMQQHTGQHVLSAAFDRLFGIRTVSFHMGAIASTIDLAREATPAPRSLQPNPRPTASSGRIGRSAIRYATAEEAARMPLRKESVRGGTLRLVDVEGFDLSACGGTHVARTGGIGVIAVASWERFKGGQRLEFLCGGRALHRLADSARRGDGERASAVGAAGGTGRGRSSGCSPKRKSRSAQWSRCRATSPATVRWNWPRAPRKCG